ncbi:hypothetical protein ACI2K4_09575 [Micromonospora sp. NPDC050397]|uniref:hypothetical protein n=1 Tax=Micromonospora sp. NPDC050397 TaxID=3364279 RepID=UPI00384D5DEA
MGTIYSGYAFDKLRVAVIVFCVTAAPLLVVAGLTTDSAPQPVGVLLDGTVLGHVPSQPGAGNSALLSVETADGRVICGMEQALFPNRLLPPIGTSVTVDYADGGCHPEPIDNTGLRVGLVLFGSTCVIGVSTYFWRNSRLGRRFRAAREVPSLWN